MQVQATDEARRARLAQETSDTAQRVALGGAFYVLGWLVVGGFAGVHRFAPVPAALLLLAFVALALARRRPPPPAPGAAAAAMQAWLDRQWTIVIGTGGLWAGVLAWAWLDPRFEPARIAALLCTVAYATAFAHNFSTRLGRALAGVGLLYLPAPALVAAGGGSPALALTLAIFGVYLALITRRSHAEYQRQLDVDQALRLQRDQYEHLSRTDALTGLSNRRHFSAALEHLEAEAARRGQPLSLLVIDLDHFKRVNDENGHEAGDACLARFGERLCEVFAQPGAHLARLGGEEFAVLLPGLDAPAAAALAETLRASLAARPLPLREGLIRISVSVGVAGRGPGQDAAAFFRAADQAMYRAKAEGRDRVRVAGA